MSHKDFENIEELFRSGLEDMEVPVNDTMWSSISKNINVSGIGSGTSTVVTGSSNLLTYLGLAGAACVVGIVGTLVYTNLNQENVFKHVPAIEMSQQHDDNQKTNEVAQLTEVTENSNIDAVPASQEDRNIVEEIIQPSPAKDPVVKKDQENPKKTVVVVEESSHNYGNSWVEYFLTPSNSTYTEPTNNNSDEDNVVSNPVKPTIAEIEENEVIASIVAAPVGGYAPLEVSFAQYNDNASVYWDFGDGYESKESNPTHVFEKYGKYSVTLTVIDSEGKKHQDTRVVEVLANSALTKIPNIFTPNGDGTNDEFRVEGKNLEAFNLAILNTNGEILYQTTSIDESWEGKDKFGNELSEGTYVVVISARGIDGKKYEHSGTVVLNR